MAVRKQISLVPPQLKKLQKKQDLTTAEIINALRKAQKAIAKEVAYLSSRARVMTNAKQRDKIYKLISGHYKDLATDLDEHIAALMASTAQDTHEQAVKDLKTSGAKSILKYSPARTARYLEMVNNGTSGSMAAVFTDQMAANEIRALRTAWVSAYREASLSGMTANDTQRLLQDKWDQIVDNTDSFRFVDKSGKSWSNARYLQMLVRTNSQRVVRDSYIDTLVENGFKLARISDDGDADCPICAAWEGRIVQVAGNSKRWPTYEDAVSAGVFHSNCTHRLEYMDETVDAEEIALQGKIPKPPAGSTNDFVQQQKDTLDENRYMATGMNREQARRAVTSERLKNNILTGTFNESAQAAIDRLSDTQLDEIREKGIPRFLMVKKGDDPGWNKGSSGGIVRIPRMATADNVLEAMGLKERIDPVAPPPEIAEKRTNAVKQVHKRGKGNELFVCITPNGTVLHHDSGASGGIVPVKMRVNNSVFVHNHPSGYKNIRNKTLRYGNSFSKADLVTAASFKLKEIVAVTPQRIYSMQPGVNNWPSSNKMNETVRSAERQVRSRMLESIKKGRIDTDTASMLHYHLVSKHVAKELGLNYSWKKNSR